MSLLINSNLHSAFGTVVSDDAFLGVDQYRMMKENPLGNGRTLQDEISEQMRWRRSTYVNERPHPHVSDIQRNCDDLNLRMLNPLSDEWREADKGVYVTVVNDRDDFL